MRLKSAVGEGFAAHGGGSAACSPKRRSLLAVSRGTCGCLVGKGAQACCWLIQADTTVDRVDVVVEAGVKATWLMDMLRMR